MAIDINLNDVQVKPIVVNADLTAVLDRTYNVVASAIFTDPTPIEGKGFIVFVRNGTATVGGVGYSTAGTVIRRIYHSGAWANYTGTSVDVNTIGAAINGATSATPNDTDLVMSVDTSVAKKNTWTQIKAFLKTYFDTVYTTTSAVATQITTAISGKEDTSNKSSSYTASSTTTYANTKALVDGLNSVRSSMYAVASGTDTYAASVTPALTAYATGQQFRIKIPNLNTVTNPTLNINSLGAKTIKGVNGAAIPIGQFYANGDFLFVYDGTDFILQAGIMDRKDFSYFRKTGTTTYERWYSTNITNAALTTNPFLSKDIIRAIPFIVSKTTTLDRIGMEITGAGTAGSVLRLGIYDDVNGVPTNLILDAGTIAADSATAQTIKISQVLTPGLYYLTFVHNSTATITVRAHFAYTHPQICGFNASWNLTQNAGSIAATFTYGTLPSTFPTTAIAPITGSVVPAIFVRLS